MSYFHPVMVVEDFAWFKFALLSFWSKRAYFKAFIRPILNRQLEMKVNGAIIKWAKFSQ